MQSLHLSETEPRFWGLAPIGQMLNNCTSHQQFVHSSLALHYVCLAKNLKRLLNTILWPKDPNGLRFRLWIVGKMGTSMVWRHLLKPIVQHFPLYCVDLTTYDNLGQITSRQFQSLSVWTPPTGPPLSQLLKAKLFLQGYHHDLWSKYLLIVFFVSFDSNVASSWDDSSFSSSPWDIKYFTIKMKHMYMLKKLHLSLTFFTGPWLPWNLRTGGYQHITGRI